MRVNQPVTKTEIELKDAEPLVSRTDPGGRILFANQVFVDTSGYSEQELVGAPHNLVRHPDMPPQAFANLWTTIKAGRPWDGLVKNRAKTGDFYWVRANVTPVVDEAGEVTGYLSIRSKPSRDSIRAAEKAYAAIRAGTAKHIGLADGELVKTGALAWLGALSHSMFGRLAAVAVAALLAMLIVGWQGFTGMAASNAALRHVYEHDLIAVNQLRTISDRLRDSRNLIAQMTIALGRGTEATGVLAEREPPVRANLAAIATAWRDYQSGDLTDGQRGLVTKFDRDYGQLRQDIIEQAFHLARAGDIPALNRLFEQQAPPLFQTVFNDDRELVDQQIGVGEILYKDADASLQRRLFSGIGAGLFCIVAVLGLCWALVVTFRRSTRVLEDHFVAISRGDLTADIKRPAAREFQRVTSMLRAMRAHLAFKSWEGAEFERKAVQIRRETIDRMAQTIEQETGSSVESVALRTGAMASDADAMAASAERVGANARHVAQAADQAMANVHMVASASEQLVTAIRQVSAQVDHASAVASRAASQGAAAQQIILSLSEAGDRIGTVVRLIADIASKTNLLALNATIEAARAGDAGKGFAVVAGEVKALATQTAKATEEISQQITGLRGATEQAVAAVAEIGQTLQEVTQVAVSVAEAVGQQTAATQQIAGNVAESGAAVQEVTRRIAEVSTDVDATGSQAVELRRASGVLAEDIAALRGALVRTVRTATTDANRRVEQRVAVDEPCTIITDHDSQRMTARIGDISLGGAAILKVAGGGGLHGAGTLILDRAGGGRTRFEIRAADPDGSLHVQFDRSNWEPGFEHALHAMLDDNAADALAAPLRAR
jgi:methyl-accepting chemotaxis protein/aerotaxis receptor